MIYKLKGRWKGIFILGEEYGDNEGDEKTFILFIEEEKDDKFKGKSVDYEGYGENYNPASINGYVQGSFISFIKQYPFLYEVNENNESIYNREEKHPEIHYEGQYDLKEKKFSGTWEMVIQVIEMHENDLEQLLRGKWEMSKDAED